MKMMGWLFRGEERDEGEGWLCWEPLKAPAAKILTCFVLGLLGSLAAVLVFFGSSLTTPAWNVLVFFIALVLCLVLCAVQAVVLTNLWEYSEDHLNHFDVEKSIRRLVTPEQALQVLLPILFYLNGAWIHFMIQLPLAVWHVFCLLTGRKPVQAVLGREDQLRRELTLLKRIYVVKTFYYGITFILCFMGFVSDFVRLVVASNSFSVIMNGLRTSFGSAVAPHITKHPAMHSAVRNALASSVLASEINAGADSEADQ